MRPQILIFKMWSYRQPLFAILITIFAVFFWPALPLHGIGNWMAVLANTPYLLYFYPIISIFSGVYVGLYVYNKKVAPCCSIESTQAGFLGSLTGIFLGACPACIPVIAVFFPLAFNVFLSRIAPIFSFLSVLVLLLVIYRMNGFKRLV